MEVDSESTNTSVEDKTEDFGENPTRDALAEGLMRLLKPTVDQLDDKIRTIRISQVELKQQIESLSDELKRINERNPEKNLDLEVYIKKLVAIKQKLTVVSNILQNSEERLLKLQQNIARDSTNQKVFLETSNAKQSAVLEKNEPSIQLLLTIQLETLISEESLNISPMDKIKTPQLNHLNSCSWKYVYEPAEDSFLLLDALEQDLDFLHAKKPRIVVEVGSGSGIIITALSKVLGSSSHCLAVDINPFACKTTKSTSVYNQAAVDVIQCDLIFCLKEFSVDMIIFNPPYVVTPREEVNSADLLTRSWAGGADGAEVINRFLSTFANCMEPKSFGYLLLLKENNCSKIMNKLKQLGFNCEVPITRKVRGEELLVVKFIKM